ncbi:MAG: Gfo/Idh/MocA family oxidoreductase [Bacteroidales bacterium]|nr:Gfo/Idh/MocA family oxidoreductase [Bacteroidales bacterium]
MTSKKICVIGCGRWGKNHLRTLASLGSLAAAVDVDDAKLSAALEQYPAIKGNNNIEEAVMAGYDGYVVATPAETHLPLAMAVISKGLNVLVEKPMTLTANEAQMLIDAAKKSGSRLMVGHVLLFHPAIRKIKELIDSGRIGKLYYLYSTRLNLGNVRTKESVFSSFAPHDISVLNYLIGSKPVDIQAKGVKFLQDEVYDTTMTMLEYSDNIHAHIYVSWLHPFKEQRLVVVGSTGMISFDDSTVEKEIHLYNKRIDFEKGMPVKVEQPDEIVKYEYKPPLEEELKYFIENLDGKISVNIGEDGLEVVKILESVEKMIKK